jgi:hypothetical protein
MENGANSMIPQNQASMNLFIFECILHVEKASEHVFYFISVYYSKAKMTKRRLEYEATLVNSGRSQRHPAARCLVGFPTMCPWLYGRVYD